MSIFARKSCFDASICGCSNGGHPISLPQVGIPRALQDMGLILNTARAVHTTALRPRGASKTPLLNLQPVGPQAKLGHDPHVITPGQVTNPGLPPHPGLRCEPICICVKLEASRESRGCCPHRAGLQSPCLPNIINVTPLPLLPALSHSVL